MSNSTIGTIGIGLGLLDAGGACWCCGGHGGDGGNYMGRWEWPCEACNGSGRVGLTTILFSKKKDEETNG